MESKVQQLGYENPRSLDNMTTIKDSEPGELSTLSSNNKLNKQVSKISQKISDFSEQLPTYILSFYDEYKQLIISFTLLVVVVNALKILLAITGAISDIPLISPIFELIGFGYVIWFAFRYFFKSDTRQEVVGEIDSLKKQIADEKT
ncbi:hypothetical protein A6770_35785 [Nostoc minutum NIES-26]|uniref:Cyanobacterial aminoacyl-tRNA synthetase CAAD domain-containing protein n=1 Tax=Nostoc minutum NIES-26 TaxID=1844469 RepID=A0A367S1R1_9NOSO|nr:hypothetical protein A6770_35785 [Nostoc minutum NIES-26]